MIACSCAAWPRADRPGGLSPATHDCLALLAQSNFDYVIIETVGTGQEAMPFQKNGIVDSTVLVMNPDYGSRLQLQKIVMLDLADIVVVNKSDLQRARTAHTEIEQRLEQNRPARRSLGEGGRTSNWSIRSQNGTATLASTDCLS